MKSFFSFLLIICTSFVVLLIHTASLRGQGSSDIPLGLKRYESSQPHMGVLISITAYCENEEKAKAAFDAAFAEFAKVDQLFSNYKSDSAINQLMDDCEQGRAIKIDDEMWPLFKRSHEIAQATDGGFDFTLGNLTELWRTIRKSKKMPNIGVLDRALASSGRGNVSCDLELHQITVRNNALRFDFGGIAKGYAADLALAALKKHGINSALVNAAGDIAVGNPPPSKLGWKIAIRNFGDDQGQDNIDQGEKYIEVKNCGIATSGDEIQFVEIEGTRYSHILNPKTGLGMQGKRSVTVVADSAADADAFASAFNVLPMDKIQSLLESNDSLGVHSINQSLDQENKRTSNLPNQVYAGGKFPDLKSKKDWKNR